MRYLLVVLGVLLSASIWAEEWMTFSDYKTWCEEKVVTKPDIEKRSISYVGNGRKCAEIGFETAMSCNWYWNNKQRIDYYKGTAWTDAEYREMCAGTYSPGGQIRGD